MWQKIEAMLARTLQHAIFILGDMWKTAGTALAMQFCLY